jgi:TonB-dependent starch-binding outer membrane protein SusC
MKTMYQKFLLLLLMLPLGLLAQTKTATGTVRDNTTGQPIPGVSVIVVGTQNSTSTDMDGNFTLANVPNGSQISFSFIGFATQTVAFTGQATISVVLAEDATQLQEVVVIGYGTTTKKNATAAITTVDSEHFQKGPIVGAEQLIQGRAAGVQVTNGGGEPGGGSLVRIRTGSSYLNNDPLYVIDGVPVEVGGGGASGGRNPLASINQNDIESMTILKDAAATAIYGSRASNGVIIITTKRGKAGDMKVTYNGNFQVNQVVKTVDVLNANEYRDFVNSNSTGSTIPYASWLGTANTDWQKQIYRTAYGTDHNIAAQGGTDNIVYRAGMGYTNMNGMLLHDNFERTTLSANVTGNFFDRHLKIELNNRTSIMQNNYSSRDAIGAAVAFDPTQPVRNADGTFFQWYKADGTYEPNASRNPMAFLEQKHNYGSQGRSIGNAQLEYKIHGWEDMKLVANLGYDYSRGRTWGDTDAAYIVPGEAGGRYEGTTYNKNQVMDLYFNYTKYLESIKTNFEVTGGYNYQDFKYENNGYSYDPANEVLNPGIPSKTRLNLQSYFGRATFTINNKYILNGSFRTDGSSRFTEENRWGYFPAASVAWKLKEENFLKDSKVVSDLKLRTSWGITGQQDTGALYPAVPLYSVSNANAQYPLGFDASGAPLYYNTYRPLSYNQDLKWEETATWNFGLDFGFFNDRVTGSVEYYTRKTSDLIVRAPNPQGVNFSNFNYYNIGDMKNHGVEVSVDTYPIRTQDLTWRIGGNITFQKSEITKLTTQDAPGFLGYNTGGISGGVGSTIQNQQVGFWPGSFFVFEQAYGTDGKPLDGVYVDRNSDGIINELDKYHYHKPQADVFYGFNTDFEYKNWWLSMSFRGSVGNYNYNNVFSNTGNAQTGLPTNGAYLNNIHSDALNSGFIRPNYLSDYYVQDASFLRMDNVTLGYTFKDVFSKGSTMRLTGAVQNVFVITGYNGIDPEISGGIDNNFYPRPRTYTVGLNVNF